jgi:hypothetical protein
MSANVWRALFVAYAVSLLSCLWPYGWIGVLVWAANILIVRRVLNDDRGRDATKY